MYRREVGRTEAHDSRVDDMKVEGESAIRVTSKRLDSTDFEPSPPTTNGSDPTKENNASTIDGSHISGNLEGVLLKPTVRNF